MVKEKLVKTKMPVEAIVSLREGKDVVDPDGKVLYRVEEYTYPPKQSKKYCYCSDTVFDPTLVEYIKEVDLLYHEATFGDDETERAGTTFHSTSRQAGIIAMKANVGKLLLGHYSSRYKDLTPILDQAKEVFENTYLSEEGVTYSI
jgi:ribonuclease Z